ncbi:MAG: YvcK family protein [bacterium]|nr:YvcK family protein [bacterium]
MSKNKEKKSKIVVIGGGTGVFTVLTGLRKYPVDLTAIISMADDGGSTGVLREEFGILPPGDVRRALVALARADNKMLSELFNYRFSEGGFKNHVFGNILLTALERLTGSFERALDEAGKILSIHGRVIPVTLASVHLVALLEDGTVIRGETNIDIPKHDPLLHIKKIYLSPAARANLHATEAIRAADLVVIGPGDLFTSIIPNLLVRGIPEAIKKSRAKKVFIVNTMTKAGETNGFSAGDFLRELETYLGRGVLDYIVINKKTPDASRLTKYKKEGKAVVAIGNLPPRPKAIFGDFLRHSGYARHDPDALARSLIKLL